MQAKVSEFQAKIEQIWAKVDHFQAKINQFEAEIDHFQAIIDQFWVKNWRVYPKYLILSPNWALSETFFSTDYKKCYHIFPLSLINFFFGVVLPSYYPSTLTFLFI